MLLILLGCQTTCPEGSTLADDGLCYIDEVADSGAPVADSGLPADTGTADTAQPADSQCPEQTSTEEYDRYPVYIAGTDRRFTTIQNGIWGAESGDVVTVCPGTYYENIDFVGKVITLTSEQGPWVTVIDGQQLDSVVTLKNYEPPESILQGFTLRNGDAVESRHGGGIYIEWGSPTIRYNVIVNNSAHIAGGVYVRNGGAVVHNNIIALNTATEGGGGIVCTACTGAYRYNTLYDNRCGNGPVGEWFWGIGDLEGNILAAPEANAEAALRWMEPRGPDFETGYNVVWPYEAIVRDTEKGPAEDWPEGEGMVWADPLLVAPDEGDFTLAAGSPAIDAGPVDELDPDGTRADIGAYGGPDGAWPWP